MTETTQNTPRIRVFDGATVEQEEALITTHDAFASGLAQCLWRIVDHVREHPEIAGPDDPAVQDGPHDEFWETLGVYVVKTHSLLAANQAIDDALEHFPTARECRTQAADIIKDMLATLKGRLADEGDGATDA